MNEKEHSAEFLMMKLLHVYAAKTFHQLSHVNLHPGQMPMLNLLYQQDGLSQKEICSKLCIKPSHGDSIFTADGKISSGLSGNR